MEAIAFFLARLAPSLVEWGVMLFPLAIYLLWLGFGPGRSRQPVILSGAQDTFLLALALSGFLLIGPPTWLLQSFARSGWKSYLLGYVIYLGIMSCLVWAWISHRRRSLVIYGIRPEAFPPLLRGCLEELHYPHAVTPGRVAIEGNRLVLDLDASVNLYCMTISWTGDAETWKSIQNRLLEKLNEVETIDNPAGSILPLWGGLALLFVSLSAVIFGWYWAYISL